MTFWHRDRSVAELAASWAPPPSRFVEIDGMQVHVRDEGPRDARPPIVLLHGTGNSLHTWDGWAERLRGEYRVVRLDRPGFGLTGPNPTGDYTMAYFTGFVRRFLDVMQIERCVLAGNSAGGGVAWHVALDEPRRVERLVLLASSGYRRTTPRSAGFRLAMSPLGPLLLRLASRATIEKSVRATYGDPSKVTPQSVDRTFEVMSRAGVRDALGAALRQADAVDDSARIRAIAVSTLVLWGTEDRVVPPSDGRRFAGDIRDSELVMLPGVGHLPQEEDPDGSVAALLAFLAKP